MWQIADKSFIQLRELVKNKTLREESSNLSIKHLIREDKTIKNGECKWDSAEDNGKLFIPETNAKNMVNKERKQDLFGIKHGCDDWQIKRSFGELFLHSWRETTNSAAWEEDRDEIRGVSVKDNSNHVRVGKRGIQRRRGQPLWKCRKTAWKNCGNLKEVRRSCSA